MNEYRSLTDGLSRTRRLFPQKLVVQPQLPILTHELREPSPLTDRQRRLRHRMGVPILRNPVAKRPLVDPQLTRDLRDRSTRLDHNPHGFILNSGVYRERSPDMTSP
jgi:hypothetical protein